MPWNLSSLVSAFEYLFVCFLEEKRPDIWLTLKEYHVRQRVIKAMKGEQVSRVLEYLDGIQSRQIQEAFLEEAMLKLNLRMCKN